MHTHQSNSHPNNDSLPVYSNLSQIYADIEGELCSKQSTQLNKLKNTFSSVYSGLLPSHYVIINHVLSLSDFAHSKTLAASEINMACENGIIILVKQTYLNQKIFINGILEDQLILDSKGCLSLEDKSSLSNPNHQLIEDIQNIIQLANDQLALNKLHGATLLVYSTIAQNTQFYKEKLLLGIFLSTLIINERLDHLSLEEIYHKLYQSRLFSLDFLQTQFMPFNKGEIILKKQFKNHQNQNPQFILQSFKIPNKQKLLFYDLNLTQQHLQNAAKVYSETQILLNKTQMSQFQELYDLTSSKILQLQNGSIPLSKFINQLQKQINLNPKLSNILSPLQTQLQTQIDEIANLLNKDQNDCILSGSHLIFCFKSHEIHQKIRTLRKFIQSQFNQNPQIITSRFNSANGVDKIIFSSSPSLAIAILNPQNQIWFK